MSSFVAETEGDGFTAFQEMDNQSELAVQRPSLFDFSRDEQDVRTPVLNDDDRSDD